MTMYLGHNNGKVGKVSFQPKRLMAPYRRYWLLGPNEKNGKKHKYSGEVERRVPAQVGDS